MYSTVLIKLQMSGSLTITSSTALQLASTNLPNTASESAMSSVLPGPTPPALVSRAGLSNGAVAGIAVAAATTGAAMVGLMFFLLSRRYIKRTYTTYQSPTAFNGGAPHEKASLGSGTAAIALVDTYLPQPAEDDAISGEMSRIRDKIKNHVQSFYTTSAVHPDSVDQSRLLDLAHATGLPPAKLQDMLLNPHSRMTAIRLYLAWVILSRCGTQNIGGPSFLPGEVAAFAVTLSENDSSVRSNGKLVLSTKWKAISGELLRNKYSNQDVSDPSLEQSISQAMAEADVILLPFVNTSLETGSEKRLRNLEAIMRRAAHFAFLVFSQPSMFSLEWAAQKGDIVIFPGLHQIVDENGNMCHPPRVFSDSELVEA